MLTPARQGIKRDEKVHARRSVRPTGGLRFLCAMQPYPREKGIAGITNGQLRETLRKDLRLRNLTAIKFALGRIFFLSGARDVTPDWKGDP